MCGHWHHMISINAVKQDTSRVPKRLIAVVCVWKSVEMIITEVNLILQCLCNWGTYGDLSGQEVEAKQFIFYNSPSLLRGPQLFSFPLYAAHSLSRKIEWPGSSNQRLRQQHAVACRSSSVFPYPIAQEHRANLRRWLSHSPLISPDTAGKTHLDIYLIGNMPSSTDQVTTKTLFWLQSLVAY